MRIFALILILASFLQAAFLPINLVLILIIARSLCIEEKENYFLALISGIFLGLLTSINLGFWALIFLFVVKFTHLIKKLPISTNLLTILLASFLIIFLTSLTESLIYKSSLNYFLILVEGVLTLPIYLLVKLWEERFVVKSDSKLRI